MTTLLDEALSQEALLAALSMTSISVPERTRGRTTQQVETWTICRLLATLGQNKRLEFPLSIIHRDRPDILLIEIDKKTGIEITEAVPQQWAEYCAIAEREFPDALLEPAHFGWGAPKRTLSELRALLSQKHLSSDGWAGDQPEREWALFMQASINRKIEKISRNDFVKFNQNWLVIYDGLPFNGIDIEKTNNFLKKTS